MSNDDALLTAAKELRDACAATFRVLAEPTITPKAVLDAWIAEMERIGITPGFGVRADRAIADAEGR